MDAARWKHELIEQLTFAWDYQFVRRMEGLTDDEYLREPVPNCLSIRPDANGIGVADADAWQEPAPFTTIAWRMHHMASFFSARFTNHFGDGDWDWQSVPAPLTADEGMTSLQAAFERWRDALLAMDPEKLDAPCGPAEGPYSEHPFATLVLHITPEMIHHGAECCLLRDLYLHSKPGDR